MEACVTNQTQLLAQPKGAQAIQGQGQGQQGLARSGELFQAQGAPGTDHGHRQVMEAKGIPNLNMTRVKQVGAMNEKAATLGGAPALPPGMASMGNMSQAVA